VENWNDRQACGRALWFYPTIGAAIAAAFPWLTFCCPACTVVGSVDLRKLDRHQGDDPVLVLPALRFEAEAAGIISPSNARPQWITLKYCPLIIDEAAIPDA
jgi:hypothetical protein